MDTPLTSICPSGYVPTLNLCELISPLRRGVSLGDGYQMLLGVKTVRKLSSERWEHKADEGLTKQHAVRAAGLVNG